MLDSISIDQLDAIFGDVPLDALCVGQLPLHAALGFGVDELDEPPVAAAPLGVHLQV